MIGVGRRARGGGDLAVAGELVVVGRRPGDVVDRAGALRAAAGRRVVVPARAALVAGELPGVVVVAGGREPQRLEQRRARGRAVGIGAHAREALQRVLFGDVVGGGAQWRVGRVVGDELVLEPLVVFEADAARRRCG